MALLSLPLVPKPQPGRNEGSSQQWRQFLSSWLAWHRTWSKAARITGSVVVEVLKSGLRTESLALHLYQGVELPWAWCWSPQRPSWTCTLPHFPFFVFLKTILLYSIYVSASFWLPFIPTNHLFSVSLWIWREPFVRKFGCGRLCQWEKRVASPLGIGSGPVNLEEIAKLSLFGKISKDSVFLYLVGSQGIILIQGRSAMYDMEVPVQCFLAPAMY